MNTDALIAGDTTFVRSRLDGLRARLEQLAQERLCAELADDFAYTNGKIARIDSERHRVHLEIERLTAEAS